MCRAAVGARASRPKTNWTPHAAPIAFALCSLSPIDDTPDSRSRSFEFAAAPAARREGGMPGKAICRPALVAGMPHHCHTLQMHGFRDKTHTKHSADRQMRAGNAGSVSGGRARYRIMSLRQPDLTESLPPRCVIQHSAPPTQSGLLVWNGQAALSGPPRSLQKLALSLNTARSRPSR